MFGAARAFCIVAPPGDRASALSEVTVRNAVIALAGLLGLAAAARGDVDVPALNGDKVTGTLSPATEVERFTVNCPAGAVLTAKAKAGKKGPSLTVRILDGASGELRSGSGKSVSLATLPLPASGTYRIEVKSQDGATQGDYSLSISWKSRAVFTLPLTLAANATGTLPFAADAGAKATFAVKAPKGSAATPALVRVDWADATNAPLAGATGAAVVPATGDAVLTAGAGAGGGEIAVSVKLKAPKSTKRKLLLIGKVAPAGAHVLAATVVGPAGGLLTADPAGPLSGASVGVPPGAVGNSVALLLGTGGAVAPGGGGFGQGGPAVFVGPEGLTFKKGAKATVTIPFDPASFPSGTADLHVYTQAANGQITEITDGLTIDAVNHTITFATSHFSVFQALRALPQPTVLGTLTSGAPHASDHFGAAVATDGAFVAAGSGEFDGAAGADSGTLLVWPLTGLAGSAAVLDPANLAPGDRFGACVAISGTTLVCGAPGRSQSRGSVFVYVLSGQAWQFQQEITADDGAAGDAFGASVAIDADTIVTGAPGASSQAGAAYVHVRSRSLWTKQARLAASSTTAADRFGASVAISADTLLVGAPADDLAFVGGGSVSVFDRVQGAWSESAQFEPPVATAELGASVALDGSVAACASPGVLTATGRASVFERDAKQQWAVLQSITGPFGRNARFGSALSLRSGTLAVGAPLATGGGAAAVYRRGKSVFEIAASLSGASFITAPGASFGASLSISGSTLAVGVPGEGVGPVTESGTAVVLSIP